MLPERSTAEPVRTPARPKRDLLEVAFNSDERALLDLLQSHALPDGTIPVSDSALIAELGLEDARYFAARMRMVAAGVLSLFVSPGGHVFARLNAPERPNPQSARYCLFVAPIEVRKELVRTIHRYRLRKCTEKAAELGLENCLPPPRSPAEQRKRAACFERGRERALPRLGVHRVGVQLGPLRPPLLAQTRE